MNPQKSQPASHPRGYQTQLEKVTTAIIPDLKVDVVQVIIFSALTIRLADEDG